jgi:hypothetical protein
MITGRCAGVTAAHLNWKVSQNDDISLNQFVRSVSSRRLSPSWPLTGSTLTAQVRVLTGR